MADQLRHLEVCAGVGGFVIGLQLALGDGVRTVGYIEREAFPAAVLLARMADESLERAPVFCGGLEDVDGRELRGEVDLITAGFPCQPYSVAGKRLGAADKRAIWPNIARLIAAVEPSAVLLENVSLNAFREPWRDLRELGFELAPPVQIGAGHIGAPHRRLRYFALAYRDGGRCQSLWQSQLSGVESSRGRQLDGRGDDGRLEGEVADTEPSDHGEDVGDSYGERLEGRREPEREGSDELPTWPPSPEGDWATVPAELHPATAEPELRGVADGVPGRMDRLRALGNAVLPQVVAAAWRELTKEASK